MRTLIGFMFALTIGLSVPVLADAQTEAADPRRDTTAADRQDDFDWGWLGLIGLAGLFGLRRRETVDVQDRNRVAAAHR